MARGRKNVPSLRKQHRDETTGIRNEETMWFENTNDNLKVTQNIRLQDDQSSRDDNDKIQRRISGRRQPRVSNSPQNQILLAFFLVQTYEKIILTLNIRVILRYIE